MHLVSNQSIQKTKYVKITVYALYMYKSSV